MHILFLAKRYLPAVGGVERHVCCVTQALKQKDASLQITVITEQHDRSLPAHETLDGVDVHRIPLLPSTEQPDLKKSIWGWLDTNRKLVQAADYIHVHDVFFWLLPSLPGLWWTPIGITFHGYEPPGPPTIKQRFWHQLADLLSDGNICVGGFHQKWYGLAPDKVTYGAIEHADIPAPRSGGTSSQNRRLLFVGRLEEDTSIWPYLMAFHQVLKKSPASTLQLDVIGEGPLRDPLERYVKYAQLPVQFLGTQQVTTQTYQRYHASLVSGYLTMMESLAAGTPAIATYSTKLKKDYLMLTPFAEWIRIAEPGMALEQAMSEQLITGSPVSSDAQAWVEQQTWSSLAEQYLALWKRSYAR